MNSMTHLAIGVGLIVGGLVLAIGFGDAEFFWFRGQPLGIVLAVLGVFDLIDYARKRGAADRAE